MPLVKSFTHRKSGARYDIHNEGAGTYVVKSEGTEVGRADVSDDGRGDYLTNVRIVKGHQRRGVATKLYDAIERDLGRRMRPSPTYQSPDAEAFWAKRSTRGRRAPKRFSGKRRTVLGRKRRTGRRT